MVKHTELYNLLGVAPDASTAQIRRAYYQRARLCHPDKHPGDAAKESEFKELSEAYQTLFDEERRSAYDVHGRAGSDGMYTDPRQVFAAVFGGPEFVPWVGTLGEVPDEVQAAQQLADAALQAVAVKRKEVQELQASGAGAGAIEGCQAELKALMFDAAEKGKVAERATATHQRQRVVACANTLRERIATFVHGDDAAREAFRAKMSDECRRLGTCSMGGEMLQALGCPECSLLAARRSPLAAPCSLLTGCWLLVAVRESLLAARYLLLAARCSLLAAHCPLHQSL